MGFVVSFVGGLCGRGVARSVGRLHGWVMWSYAFGMFFLIRFRTRSWEGG